MMSVRNFINRLKFWKRPVDADLLTSESNSPEYRLATKFKRYEKYVSELQELVLWNNPIASVFCLGIVNCLFWIMVNLDLRFYGIISSVFLILSAHDLWTKHVWPEIRVVESSEPPSTSDIPAPNVEAISRQVTQWWMNVQYCAKWLFNLRAQQPALFCCILVLCCAALLMVGRSVSGLILVYSLLMTVLIVPGVLTHLVPDSMKQTIAQYITCFQHSFDKYSAHDGSDDEYLPVTTSEDLVLLTRASDLHADTYDSITNPGSSSDIISGLDQMPSHEEDSIATLSDLDPITSLPLDHAEDSDSNPEDHQIQFQSGHFNGDSSSDEEAFTRDLKFSEADEKDDAAHRGFSSLIRQAVTSNLVSSVGLLANVIRPPQRQIRRADTDSDLDDFEIINSEELNQDKS